MRTQAAGAAPASYLLRWGCRGNLCTFVTGPSSLLLLLHRFTQAAGAVPVPCLPGKGAGLFPRMFDETILLVLPFNCCPTGAQKPLVLSLYRAFLREARQMPTPTRRNFIARKARGGLLQGVHPTQLAGGGARGGGLDNTVIGNADLKLLR